MCRVKKSIKNLILICVVMAISLMVEGANPRADINGSESSVIGAACSTFYYEGEYYRVKDAYIGQLINALDSQYDLSPAQASVCVDYIYNNVAAGIAGGYLYKVENPEGEGDNEDAGTTREETDTTIETAGGAEQTPLNDVEGSEVVVVEKKDAAVAKEDAISGAADLAAEMGVNIKFDSGKDGITITDQSGKVLISTREAIKNTGFRLNSLVIYVVAIIAVFASLMYVVKRYNLMERNYADEEAD